MEKRFAELLSNVAPENGNRVFHAAIVIAGVFAAPHGIDERGVYIYAPEIGDSPEENTVWNWATNKKGITIEYKESGTLPEWLKNLATFSDEKWTKRDLKMLGATVNWFLDDPSRLTTTEVGE